MAIRNINFGNQVGVNNHIGFTFSPVGEQTVSKKTQDGDRSKYLLYGLAGLAAIAAAGVIYVGTRGKVDSKSVIEPVGQIKEMSIGVFKKAGNKFNHGRAITAAGEGYTGTLTHTGSDGSKLSMEYVDGVLKKSTKTKNDVQIFEKSYSYDADYGLMKVEKKENGKLIAELKKDINAEQGVIYRSHKALDQSYISVQDIATRKMIKVKGKQFYYTKEGLLSATRDKDGFLTVYHSNGKPKLVQDQYGVAVYDENGNWTAKINADFGRGAESYFAKYPDRKVKYDISTTNGLSKTMSFYAPDSSRSNVILDKFILDGKWHTSASVKSGNNRYDISTNDEIWNVLYKNNPIAKYNSRTGDIDILEASVTKENVQNLIEQVKKAASSVKQEHRAARQIIREFQDVNTYISKNSVGGLRDNSFIF